VTIGASISAAGSQDETSRTYCRRIVARVGGRRIGNCFHVKPSECVPLTSQKILELFEAAGFPQAAAADPWRQGGPDDEVLLWAAWSGCLGRHSLSWLDRRP
jgi:hypothetical protein